MHPIDMIAPAMKTALVGGASEEIIIQQIIIGISVTSDTAKEDVIALPPGSAAALVCGCHEGYFRTRVWDWPKDWPETDYRDFYFARIALDEVGNPKNVLEIDDVHPPKPEWLEQAATEYLKEALVLMTGFQLIETTPVLASKMIPDDEDDWEDDWLLDEDE